MITENLSTLKIHKLSQAQYERELAAGRINENEIYLTSDESSEDFNVSWNDLTDKPFYENPSLFEPVTWDGNIKEGMETCEVYYSTMVRVGDYIPYEEVIGGTYTVKDSFGEYTELLFPTYSGNGAWAIGTVEGPFLYALDEGSSGIDDITIFRGKIPSSAGLWIGRNYMDQYVSELNPPVDIKTIDKKFLPDALQFGEELVISEVLPETSVAFNGPAGMIQATIQLVGGETYTVNWGGTEYSCEAVDSVVGIVLGDIYTASGGNLGVESTGEPFAIIPLPDENVIQIMALDGSTEQTLSITGQVANIIPIDKKYLPEEDIVNFVLNALPTWNGGSY